MIAASNERSARQLQVADQAAQLAAEQARQEALRQQLSRAKVRMTCLPGRTRHDPVHGHLCQWSSMHPVLSTSYLWM